jgi:hypothetical protein
MFWLRCMLFIHCYGYDACYLFTVMVTMHVIYSLFWLRCMLFIHCFGYDACYLFTVLILMHVIYSSLFWFRCMLFIHSGKEREVVILTEKYVPKYLKVP